MTDIQQYIRENEERFLEELFSLMRIPSISAKEEHKPDMQRCAERWKEILLSSGMDSAEVYPTEGNPVVFAQKILDPSLKTLLVYGHYDVMPVEPLEKWNSEPFEPVIREDHILGRGADDDKGQTMIQVKGFETALKLGLVKCNVKVILEGEEEVGSGSLPKFCEEHRDLLAADLILVSDTGMLSADQPSITVGLRGLAYWEIEVTGPDKDLHSGHYGGAVANPINELCILISKLMDEQNRVTIPGFYDDVVPISDKERAMIPEIPFDEKEYMESIGVDALKGEEGYHTIERRSSRPSLDLCGIWGGYTGEGAKTVIPSKAYAKVSTRLVANQDYRKISEDFVKYVESLCPPYVKVKVTPLHGGEPYLFSVDHPAYKPAEEAYEALFGVKPLAMRSGGSIPIIASFDKILGTKALLMGFGLESDVIHSPNENFPLEMFRKGIAVVAEFYARFGDEA